MSVDWVDMVQSIVFTRVKNNFSTVIKSKYKMTDANFTTVNGQTKQPDFPSVFIQLLPGTELAEDTENDNINAMSCTIQIEVNDNVSQSRTKEVVREIKRIMKTMHFSCKELPTFENNNNITTSISRYRRNLGENDFL